MKPKHADLIHAWADGAKIQYRNIYAMSTRELKSAEVIK